MFVIVAKTIISLICAGLVIAIVVYRQVVEKWLAHYNERFVLVGAWAITRLLPFLLIFVVLDFTPFSDLDGFFGQAREAVQLKMVYRDFHCMYSPVFPYLNALALWFWMDKKAIILLMILMEGLALWTTNRFYEKQLSKPERLYRSLILFVIARFRWFFVCWEVKEDEWMWLMLIGAYWVWQRTKRVEWFGAGLVVGFMFTKAVFILVGPALLFLVPKPIRWITSAAIIGGICLAVLVHYTEWLWLDQPLHEAATLRAPNWLSVINPLTFNVLNAGAKGWNWIGTACNDGWGEHG